MPNRTEGRLVNIKVHYFTLGLHHVEEVRTEVPVVGKRTVFPVCEKRYSCAAYLWQHLRYVHKPNAGHIQYTHCPLCCKGERKRIHLLVMMRLFCGSCAGNYQVVYLTHPSKSFFSFYLSFWPVKQTVFFVHFTNLKNLSQKSLLSVTT